MKHFLKKSLGHEKFRSMVSCATTFFLKKIVKPSGPPSYILNVRSFMLEFLSVRFIHSGALLLSSLFSTRVRR